MTIVQHNLVSVTVSRPCAHELRAEISSLHVTIARLRRSGEPGPWGRVRSVGKTHVSPSLQTLISSGMYAEYQYCYVKYQWFSVSLQLASPALASPIPRLIYRFHDSNCRNHYWFLQLELCTSVSANPHCCVGLPGLHDIHAADDPVRLMTDRKPVSRENGRSVSQIEASARIRRIGEESRNSEINTGFRKPTRESPSDRQNVGNVSWQLAWLAVLSDFSVGRLRRLPFLQVQGFALAIPCDDQGHSAIDVSAGREESRVIHHPWIEWSFRGYCSSASRRDDLAPDCRGSVGSSRPPYLQLVQGGCMPTVIQKDYLCGILRFPMLTGTDQRGGSCWQEQQVVETRGNDHEQHRRQDNEY